MESIQIIALALVQGLTEFLPISSSAHLILTPVAFGWQDQGLAFDVAVHLGSLTAVVWHFRTELLKMLADFFASLTNASAATRESRLAWLIILSTLPVVLFGLAMKTLVETDLRSTLVIAVTTIGFGLLLWWFDIKGKRQRDEYSLNWRDALIIGVMQAIAIIPGTSRSGITMTAGLMLGLTRAAAARYSFLLSVPTILMSGGLVTLDLISQAQPVDWMALTVGTALSFISALLCIRVFLRFIERIGMLPFVLYRLALGALLLAIAL
jgi:undecaprenyl-diphosphatase